MVHGGAAGGDVDDGVAHRVGRSVGDGLVGEGEHDGAVVRLGGVGDLAVRVGLDQALEERTVAGRADHREPVDEFDVTVGRGRGGDVRAA